VAGWGYIATMRTLRLSFHPATAWELLRFGAPLIASAAGWFVLNASDRYFLGVYRNFTEVGQYSLGYRVASLHVVGIITPLQLAFAPMVFEAAKQPGLDEKIAHIAEASAWIVGLSAGVLAMLAPIAVSLLSPAAYAHSEIYTYWILPSGVFLGVYYWAASLLHLQKRTLWIAGAVIAAAIANIALNFALIPSYGAIGAAIATDIAMLGAATLVTVLALRLQTVRLHRGKLMLATLVSGTLFALAVWLSYAPVSSSLRVMTDILAASLAVATAGLTISGRDVISRIAGLRWIASRRARSP